MTGVIGLVLMILLAFYGIRRRWHTSRLGTVEGWLQAHVWLGTFSVLVVLLHTGFRFEDRVAVTLLAVFFGVVVSGVVGAVLYRTVPRALTEVEGNLTGAALSQQINQLSRSMARLASNKSEPFQRIHAALEREMKPPALARWEVMGRARTSKTGPPAWASLLESVPGAEQNDLRQMILLGRQQKELNATLRDQRRYGNLIEVWRLVHLPLTIVLLLLLAVHVWGALRYADMPW